MFPSILQAKQRYTATVGFLLHDDEVCSFRKHLCHGDAVIASPTVNHRHDYRQVDNVCQLAASIVLGLDVVSYIGSEFVGGEGIGKFIGGAENADYQ